MKRYFLFLNLLIATIIVANAQPQITIANMMQIGDTTIMIRFDTTGCINPGASGSNVTWDYSMLDSVDHYHRYSLAPLNTPYGLYYPTANFCERSIIGSSDCYAYAKYTNDSISQVGTSGVLGDSTVFYEPITVHYPFTYLSTQTDTSIWTMFLHNGMQMRIHEKQTIHYDGYGTLILPIGTFNNVIRHTLETYIIDSVFLSNGNLYKVDTSYEKNYYWVSENYRPELLRMLVIQEINGVPHTSAIPYYYNKNPHPVSPVSVNNYKNNHDKCLIYPNPFNNITTLYIEPTNICSNTKCVIYNGLGDIVKSLNIINNETQVDCSDLSDGLYFYEVSKENKIIGNGKLIVQ